MLNRMVVKKRFSTGFLKGGFSSLILSILWPAEKLNYQYQNGGNYTMQLIEFSLFNHFYLKLSSYFSSLMKKSNKRNQDKTIAHTQAHRHRVLSRPALSIKDNFEQIFKSVAFWKNPW